MNPNEIRAKLILKGIKMSDLARMLGTSRQQVQATIQKKPIRGKRLQIWKKIMEVL